METSLHRELKELYAARTQAGQVEVRRGNYRIDAVAGEELVEIQHGSLAAIRDKVRVLLADHSVRVVKPLVAAKLLVKRARRNGPVVDRRLSPKRSTILSLFDELVYFTKVFPHPRLTLEVVLVDVEEWRRPGHGRRRRYRASDFVVEDQKLLAVLEVHSFRTANDLLALVPGDLPSPFDSGQLAEALSVARWMAQRVAYCLRETGAARQVGKRGNARLYEFIAAVPRKTTSAFARRRGA
ncbi:MAG TPA: hypothetical protein VGX76_09805 [Pirellulales bacterium]|jgi:hypothetical protein|nr:hypothetical protein [Pirellulales bacterium]